MLAAWSGMVSAEMMLPRINTATVIHRELERHAAACPVAARPYGQSSFRWLHWV